MNKMINCEIKEIYVEAKKSKNFQTYTLGLTITLPDNCSEVDRDLIIKQYQAECRKAVQEQIRIDGV